MEPCSKVRHLAGSWNGGGERGVPQPLTLPNFRLILLHHMLLQHANPKFLSLRPHSKLKLSQETILIFASIEIIVLTVLVVLNLCNLNLPLLFGGG